MNYESFLKLCQFNVFGVTETHLTSEIVDGEINIEDYSLVRRDRPGRQGGGCTIHYRKSLKVIHRPDLEDDKVEAIFMQVKAGSRDTMIGIIYRPPNQNSEFFTVFPKLLENVWLKFKSAGQSIAPSLTSMFGHSAKACKPPDQWKTARVSAAFKKGREEDRLCYRPLSMLSIPSKLVESCVASTITNHVVTQNLLDSRQWAYRKGKSTEQLLIHLTERWREAAERRLYVGVLFIDFTKAFDTVSQNMLLQKLNDLEIRGDIWLWIKNYLTDQRQFVRIN